MAQGDESATASVKHIINIFSQVLFCVTDVERALGFINDYTLSSLLEASLALRERGGGKDSPAFIDKPSSAVMSNSYVPGRSSLTTPTYIAVLFHILSLFFCFIFPHSTKYMRYFNMLLIYVLLDI